MLGHDQRTISLRLFVKRSRIVEQGLSRGASKLRTPQARIQALATLAECVGEAR